MNKIKKIAILALLTVAVLAISYKAVSIQNSTTPKSNLVKISKDDSESSIAYDPSDINTLTGYADNVFVAKVVKTESTYIENRTNIPDTVYRLKIIKNIKGELSTSKPVKIYLKGGLQKDGTLYQSDEYPTPDEGSYYIFATCNQGAPAEYQSIMTYPDGAISVLPNGLVSLDKDEMKALKSTKIQEYTNSSNNSNYKRVRFPAKDSEVYFSE